MLKYLLCFFFLTSVTSTVSAQKTLLDSLSRQLIEAPNEDTTRVLALSALADYYGFSQFDSSLYYANQASYLSQKLNYTYGLFRADRSIFFTLNCEGNYPSALEVALNIRELSEKLKDEKPWVSALSRYFIGLLYREMKDYPKAKE